jgi:hypothetical protein
MYMAPEQARGEVLDHRADLFSLGSVLYVMASGRPPFRAPTTFAVLKRVVEDEPRPIRDVLPEVPPCLCGLIGRLHAKKPQDRFASAGEVAEALGRCAAELQHPGKFPNRAAQPRFRIRRWAGATAVLLLLLGGLGVTEATGVTDVRGTVIRLFSPEGTLVVEVADPEVSIKIDGPELVITGAGAREIRLRAGPHTVEASKDGKLVRQELVTVTRNGRQVVRVGQEAPKEPVIAQAKDPDRRAAEYLLSVGALKAAAESPKRGVPLTYVNLVGNERVTDTGLAAFNDCKHVTGLDMDGCVNVTDAGLIHFKNCKNLAYLNLANVPVTDAVLAHLKQCNLMYLHLAVTHISDTAVAQLKDWKNLTFLSLAGTQVSDAGLAHLKECKGLTHLRVGATKVTAAGIDDLRKALPRCKIEWDGGVIEPR